MAQQLQMHPIEDKILVGLGFGHGAASLLRAAHAHALKTGSRLFVVSIEEAEIMSLAERQSRARALSLARQLGAEVVLASGSHVGRALLRVARELCVSALILGNTQSGRRRPFWRRDSTVSWLQRNADGLRLFLFPTEHESVEKPEGRSMSTVDRPVTRWREYLGAIGIAAAGTALGVLLEPALGYLAVALVYLLIVTLTGVFFERGPTLMLAALNAILWDLLFIPPRYSFYINRPQDVMMLAMFFAVALAVGHLTTSLRGRQKIEHRMELRATALYQLTRSLAEATSAEDVISAGCLQIGRVFQTPVAVVTGEIEEAFAKTTGISDEWCISLEQRKMICSCFVTPQLFEAPLPNGGRMLCLPLVVAGRVEGVLVLRMHPGHFLDISHRELLDAFAVQMGIALEIQKLAKEHRTSQLLAESAKFQKVLFDSVSHELNTPIAAIRVALEQPAICRDELQRATERLQRAVKQLLSVTRIESGLLKPVPEWCAPEELANEAIAVVSGGSNIRLKAADALPFISVDGGLLVQALVTLLENALTHGASEAGVDFLVSAEGGILKWEVSDRGKGIPEGLESRLFEKFYRLPGSCPGGIGLGLAIARQFVEVLGGEMRAYNRAEGGASFSVAFPLGEKTLLPT